MKIKLNTKKFTSISKQLKSYIEKHGLHQRQLAKMLNVPHETLNRWINHPTRNPSKYYLSHLEKQLKIVIDKRQ